MCPEVVWLRSQRTVRTLVFYCWTVHNTLEVTWVDEIPTFSFVQTLLDLCSSYVMEGLVQIKFCTCQNWVCIWSTMCVYTRESSWRWSSNSLEPDQPQHDFPSPCVIIQQYLSTTFISLCLPSHKEKHMVCMSEMLLFQFLYFS